MNEELKKFYDEKNANILKQSEENTEIWELILLAKL